MRNALTEDQDKDKHSFTRHCSSSSTRGRLGIRVDVLVVFWNEVFCLVIVRFNLCESSARYHDNPGWCFGSTLVQTFLYER